MQKLFTVKDLKANSCFPPFQGKTALEALRRFETTAKDTTSQFNAYPADFELLEIANFDTTSGTIISHEIPLSLGLAQQFIQ